MTTAPDDYTDDLGPDDGDELAQRRNPAERRIESKRIRELETQVADLTGKVTGYERAEALAAAKRDLNYEGPLGTFLSRYDGEPTADAIKAAVESNPEWQGLITFTPDPRDAAVAEQAANAAKMSGGAGAAMTEITPETARGWDQQRIAQFRSSHPDEWNRLLAGQTVPVPAVTATT